MQHHRLGRLLAPTRGEEHVAGLLEQLVAAALGVHSGPAQMEGQSGDPAPPRGQRAQRLRVELRRLGECVQRQRPVARVAKRDARRLGEGVSRGSVAGDVCSALR